VASKKQNELPPRLRRAYFDCRYGQLHVHIAIPSGGGFDELTPVICMPAVGESARVFRSVLQVLGYQRSVYAIDLPGSGESDPAPGVAPTAAAVNAVLDFVQSMRIRSFDLIAHTTGSEYAWALLESQGQDVRRAVMLGSESRSHDPGDKVSLWPGDHIDSTATGAKLVTALGKTG
jgi:pimeloyl-ACP methyl ester carboxylesterase